VSYEERLLDASANYFFFAHKFNWPPDVVDRQPVVRLRALAAYSEVFDELRDDAQRRANQSARRT